MVVLQQKGLTLIRAVRLMGRGGELIVHFVIVNYGDLKDKFQRFEKWWCDLRVF